MNSFAYDVTFMEERDSKFWDVGKGLERVSAKIILGKNSKDLSEEEISIMDSLRTNMPVRYRDGIFRINRVYETPEQNENEHPSWEIEIEGQFTAEDPNGHKINGWADEEIANNSIREIHTIADLEL